MSKANELILAATDNDALSTIRRGKQKLHLWPGQEADGRVDTITPSKVKTNSDMDKLEKVNLWQRHLHKGITA